MKTAVKYLLLVIMLSSCDSIYKTITTNYDHSINFNNYKTYAWVNNQKPHEPTPFDNEIIDNNIQNYVDTELSKINYIPKTDTPDLLFELVANNKLETERIITPIYSDAIYYSRFPRYSYRYYSPEGYRWNRNIYDGFYARTSYQIGSKEETRQFNRSTITINVFDRVSNKLIWTASAKGNIYDDKYDQDEIHPAIIKILRKYPIQPTSIQPSPIYN